MDIKEQNISILTDSMKLKILEDEETKKEIYIFRFKRYKRGTKKLK